MISVRCLSRHSPAGPLGRVFVLAFWPLHALGRGLSGFFALPSPHGTSAPAVAAAAAAAAATA